MLTVISPAKNLDYDSALPENLPAEPHSQPVLLEQAQQLIDALQPLTAADISSLMHISEKLGQLNHQRYLDWGQPFTPDNARQAVFAFNGDVYTGLDAASLSKEGFVFAQQHLRILSGLYGVLRPLDLMQAYRLEMGTKFAPPESGASNLYGFWGDTITEELNKQLTALDADVIVNCASNEYFKSVNTQSLQADVITPVFKDEKNGQYKIISFYAKKARGFMARYIIEQQITELKTLQDFAVAGYRYSAEASSVKELVFLRSEADLAKVKAAA